ncbi:hypothetical protein QBC47DRAFT_360893 [Echria macrotheca]|uniref:Uncharacterized protein n=1 Tax=Echria macrotheca TaxID=438768 RepID=A0AAJ0BCQ2_9PEZI|nr:hypothetical protein QBC47DRAFT_360893 [Echria macrotheca]
MPNTYTISVTNQSGNTQQYALFNEPPKVTANVDPKVWVNAVKVVPVGPGSTAKFTITSQYYGYVGSSDGKPGQDNVAVSVAATKPMTLGSKALDGTATPGDTWNMDVISGAPQFTTKGNSTGKLGAFCINTAPGTDKNNFSFQSAQENGWVIGLGKIVNGEELAAATIVPQPNCAYQVQPVNIWYITYGDYQSGQVCNFEMTGLTKATVDFTSGTSNAKVVHSAGGQITTQV